MQSRCYSTDSTTFSTSFSSRRAHRSSTPTWERDETQPLKRITSTRDSRLVNKRDDLDVESAYSQSLGTLVGELFSRSLIEFADESYGAWQFRRCTTEKSVLEQSIPCQSSCSSSERTGRLFTHWRLMAPTEKTCDSASPARCLGGVQ